MTLERGCKKVLEKGDQGLSAAHKRG